jgi:hypothetical protein
MKIKSLVALTVCGLSWAFMVCASEGGSTHYTPGSYSDFSSMPPTQPGFSSGNTFLDYGNAEASVSRQLPLGGILAAGLTANSQTESPTLV